MRQIVSLLQGSYPITIEENALYHITDTINVNRKIAIITDDGVPLKWIDIVKKQCPNSFVCTIPHGESSKCFKEFESLLTQMVQHNMTRNDAIIDVGGGVVGDLAGFVASSYMRGIDFYNIPTTVLSQVDSSVGGKVAIDLGSYKNLVGAFYQPKAVIIDPQVLSTLPTRHIHNGLVEALKSGLIQDEKIISLFEADQFDILSIIERSIRVKRKIVEEDEKEKGVRKALNFGHTIGHAIESAYGLDTYLHGECVAMGMLFFIEDTALRKRILNIYKKLSIPRIPEYELSIILDYMMHDKKRNQSTISVVKVKKAGSFIIEELNYEQLKEVLERNPYEK